VGYLKFVRRTDGTGGVLDQTTLALDASTPLPSDFKQVPDPVLTKIQVDALFFPSTALTSEDNWQAARRAAVARLEVLRSALKYRPVQVKNMARGVAVIPNVHQNFGDLVQVAENGVTENVILENCCLLESSVDGPAGVPGIVCVLIFGQVCESLTPS